jgi:hypothetical protein
MERWLETNASALALGGTVLGLFVNKKFFAVPCVVLSFLLLHALEDGARLCQSCGVKECGRGAKSMPRNTH